MKKLQLHCIHDPTHFMVENTGKFKFKFWVGRIRYWNLQGTVTCVTNWVSRQVGKIVKSNNNWVSNMHETTSDISQEQAQLFLLCIANEGKKVTKYCLEQNSYLWVLLSSSILKQVKHSIIYTGKTAFLPKIFQKL